MDDETRKLPLNNRYMLTVTLFATLGGVLFGYDQGVVSSLPTENESFAYEFPRINLDATFKGWWVSTFLISAWLGSLIGGYFSDLISRKWSIVGSCVIFNIGVVFQVIGLNYPIAFLGRAISGVAVGGLTMIVPCYISETAPSESRGSLVVLQQLAVTFGILVSYWIDYGCNYIGGIRCDPDTPYKNGESFDPRYDAPNGCTAQSSASWRVPLALQFVPAFVLLGAMIILPCTPRWLASKGRYEEARHVLKKLRGADDYSQIDDELVTIKAEIMYEESSMDPHIRELSGLRRRFAQTQQMLSHKPTLRRLFIGSAVMFFQQFMGCNAMIYYCPVIFDQLGLKGDTTSILASGVYGIVNFFSTFPAVFLIDRVGRRALLMCGAVGTMLSLIVVGAIIQRFGDDLTNHQAAGWVCVAFIYIYDINFSYSFAPIGWVLPSEIFPLGIRANAISITTSCTWICNFAIGLMTPPMIENIGAGTYFFFAAFCLLGFAFTYFVIPETKGKTLEEMDAVFGDISTQTQKNLIAAGKTDDAEHV